LYTVIYRIPSYFPCNQGLLLFADKKGSAAGRFRLTTLDFCGWLPWLDLLAALLGGDSESLSSAAARLAGAEACGTGARWEVAVGRTVVAGADVLACDSVRATGAGCMAGLAAGPVNDLNLLSRSSWALISSFLKACSALLAVLMGVNVTGRWLVGSAYFAASAAALFTASWPELSMIMLLGATLIWLFASGT
jgi:hypothetical protein